MAFNYIFEKSENNKLKPALISVGIIFGLGLITLLISGSLSYSSHSDGNYDYQTLQIHKKY